MSNGRTVTFTGDNFDDLTDLGVHLIQHPTQPAAVVFAHDADLDPVGTIAPGQVLTVDSDGARIAGMPDTDLLPLPPADVFDPSKAKVAEVQEYLREVDDPAEVARVVAAEKSGQARKSLVDSGE